MSKHYIQLDAQGNIVYGFSDAFEEPLPTDICINDEGGRHFQLVVNDRYSDANPELLKSDIALYKYVNGRIVEKTVDEKHLEKKDKPVGLSLEERVTLLEQAIAELRKAKK
jgi:hypothetical protein